MLLFYSRRRPAVSSTRTPWVHSYCAAIGGPGCISKSSNSKPLCFGRYSRSWLAWGASAEVALATPPLPPPLPPRSPALLLQIIHKRDTGWRGIEM